MSYSAAVVKPTNRLLEVLQVYSDRTSSLSTDGDESSFSFQEDATSQGRAGRKRERMREEAGERLAKKVPTMLLSAGGDLSSSSSSSSFSLKNRNQQQRLLKSVTKIQTDNDNKKGNNRQKEDEAQKTNVAMNETITTPTTLEKDEPVDELREIQKDLDTIQSRRTQVLQEVVDVWGAYKYGLTKIGALTDLNRAPDAIMPGNQA